MSMDSIKEKLTYIMEALNNSRLEKGLEAGYRVGNPGGFTQGSALQIEDLSPVMYTFALFSTFSRLMSTSWQIAGIVASMASQSKAERTNAQKISLIAFILTPLSFHHCA